MQINVMTDFAIFIIIFLLLCDLNTVRAFVVYIDIYLVTYLDLKQYLQCVNSFHCSLENILLFNTFSKIFMKISINLEACFFNIYEEQRNLEKIYIFD
jgi:hypothetical protein